MLPVLFNIGPFPLHTYGVLIAAGFLCAVFIGKKQMAYSGYSAEKFVDMSFWCLFIGMLGARSLYIITRWDYFFRNPQEMLYVWEGGLVFYGGPIFAFPYIAWFCKKNGYSLWRVLDVCAICLPLAHAFGRLGCLSAGCCYGKPTDLPWGIKLYSDLVDAHMHGIPLHPTQLYEFTALSLLTVFLYKRMRTKKFDGEIMVLYLMMYAIIRSVVEAFRGDLIRGFVIDDWLSTSQFISIIGFFVGLWFYIKKRKVSSTHDR